MGATSTRPGRHRSEAANDAIRDATLELLRERGYAGLTVAAVIELAGVSSATLYRRWPTKLHLVVAAVASLTPEQPNIDTGSLAGDLAELLAYVSHSVTVRYEHVADALTVESTRNPELAEALREKFLVPRMAQLRLVVERAMGRGELASALDTSIAMSLVLGPFYHHVFSLREPLTDEFLAVATRAAVQALIAVAR